MDNILDDIDRELEEDCRRVTISVQMRNKKKAWTIVEDLDIENSKKFLKFVKKNLHCNGKYDKEKNVYQFQGNHKDTLKKMISDIYNISLENITIKS
jgi:translation initiation factor 1 (eIF-1/SUI1)